MLGVLSSKLQELNLALYGGYISASQDKGLGNYQIRYRDYFKTTHKSSAHSEVTYANVYREIYIQSQIAGKISLCTQMLTDNWFSVDGTFDGHHVQYYEHHGTHLIIDGKNIGYHGGEVTFEDKPLT